MLPSASGKFNNGTYQPYLAGIFIRNALKDFGETAGDAAQIAQTNWVNGGTIETFTPAMRHSVTLDAKTTAHIFRLRNHSNREDVTVSSSNDHFTLVQKDVCFINRRSFDDVHVSDLRSSPATELEFGTMVHVF